MPPRRRPLPTALRIGAGLGAALALSGCAASVSSGDHAAAPEDGHRATAPTSDGTFNGTGSYETPGGRQEIDVTVVVADGVVTGLRVDPAATNATSRRFQERFASAVVDAVVGRPVDEVEVGRLAGSSSTGSGFMAALDEVVRDAAGS